MNASIDLLIRLHARLVGLYPDRYRHEYAEEMRSVFSLALERAVGCGNLALVRFAGRELRDLPASIVRRHWRERNSNMGPVISLEPYRKELAGRQWLVLLLPVILAFSATLASILFPTGTGTGPVIFTLVFWALAAVVFAVIVVGLWRSLPIWALPSLGAVLGMINLLLWFLYASPLDLLTQAVSASLTGTQDLEAPVSYVVRNILTGFGMYLPLLLSLLALVTLSAVWPVLAAFNDRIHNDWSLLSFMLYSGLILGQVTVFADYQYDAPYQLAGFACFALGILLYLQGRTPWQRLAGLLAGILLMLLVNAVGIYLIFPLQDPHFNTFPRWYESLLPVGPALGIAILLILPAWLVRYLPGSLQTVKGFRQQSAR